MSRFKKFDYESLDYLCSVLEEYFKELYNSFNGYPQEIWIKHKDSNLETRLFAESKEDFVFLIQEMKEESSSQKKVEFNFFGKTL